VTSRPGHPLTRPPFRPLYFESVRQVNACEDSSESPDRCQDTAIAAQYKEQSFRFLNNRGSRFTPSQLISRRPL
jgi:hypothetical protein